MYSIYDSIIVGCDFMCDEMFYAKAASTELCKNVKKFKEKMKKLTKTGWLNASDEDTRLIVDEYVTLLKEFKETYGI